MQQVKNAQLKLTFVYIDMAFHVLSAQSSIQCTQIHRNRETERSKSILKRIVVVTQQIYSK